MPDFGQDSRGSALASGYGSKVFTWRGAIGRVAGNCRAGEFAIGSVDANATVRGILDLYDKLLADLPETHC
ncbi:hypothetical protein IB244_21095 [Rhizobium sp. RHZ02]|uniref:hypothetical protein n=1 Tax=unclassified Rhizobium TaxID=2613769 RepID=UPI0003658A6C|nr:MULTISPECIES: hypothetical protein [unclassified Rhizobium]MBD9454010.1 hypothetical protein [Rhizobium sp. RHZ02]